MQRSEADETLDQLHEVLDERFEAGPADYVISQATAQSIDADAWAVEVVYTPRPGAGTHGLRLRELNGRTPLEAAWEVYRRLEADPPADNGDVTWTEI